MKKFLPLVLVCFLSTCVIEAKSLSSKTILQIETPDDPPATNKIDLFGDLVLSAGPDSVEAFLCRSYVQVNFHQNFGYVNLTLIGETGNMVYSGNVNTAVQQTVYIPIAGIPSGNYTLVLDNANGEAEGDFAKQ